MHFHAFRPVHAFAVAVTLVIAAASQSALAQGSPMTPGEQDFKEQNTPRPVSGTHKSRQAERKVKRAQLSAENKEGKIPKYGEAGPASQNPNPKGLTHPQRHEERRAKQKELAELEKSGKMPVSNEAGVNIAPAR